MAMNTEATNNSLKKNNDSTDQLVSENSDFESLTDQENKLTDGDLELTDDNLEEAVGGIRFFVPSA
ncbi:MULTISPECIES: hypothetical protein [unclassified Moorena]|uniref:hypothetical protein n=1 Tax=unclassified Moorena TaxID=2683338 RepID=UPI0014013F43|nr:MULTISPECIES: hypothetical protein [unclassified Moorena]NEO11980.1 hypothetical protein [Moorena sp. SIO3E8]NEQ03524.1 hypothetical protein [Moorena sp. SIO3F7]